MNMYPKEAAIDLIKNYVLRGDGLQSLRTSYMGSYNDSYGASIAGYAWKDNKLIHKGTIDEIVVTRLGEEECCHVFKLKKLYDEIISGQKTLF